MKALKSRSRYEIYPPHRSRQTFPPERKKISVSRTRRYPPGLISPRSQSRSADSLAPFQFRPTDQTPTCGRRISLARQAGRSEETRWVLCAVEGDDDARRRRRQRRHCHRRAAPRRAAVVVVVARRSDRHRRATSSWRRLQRRGLPPSTTRLGNSSRSL